MPNPNCPKCGRKTYSARWKTCTAESCPLNPLTVPTSKASRVTKPVTVAKVKPVTGKRGPAAVYASPAARQKAYRARKKATA